VVQDSRRNGRDLADESQPIEGTVLTRSVKLDASQASADIAWASPTMAIGATGEAEDNLSAIVLREVRRHERRPAHGEHREHRWNKSLRDAQVPAITSTWQIYRDSDDRR